MSKNRNVLDLLADLIKLLDETGVLELPELLDKLKYVETDIAAVEFRKNIDYRQVAKYLDKIGCVFLAINRKRAWYARNKLKEITGRDIEYVKAIFGDKSGYLFSFSDSSSSSI